MGGCFSLPDPTPNPAANVQPPQPGAPPVAKSLRQSIRNFFKKVKTKRGNNQKVPEKPQAEEDRSQNNRNIHPTVQYRRSRSLDYIKKKQKELRDAKLQKATRRCNPKYEGFHSRYKQDMRRELETDMILIENRLKMMPNLLDQNKTSPEEEHTNVQEVTATGDSKNGASASDQFEFGSPRVVRGSGTDDSAVDENDEESSSSKTVTSWRRRMSV